MKADSQQKGVMNMKRSASKILTQLAYFIGALLLLSVMTVICLHVFFGINISVDRNGIHFIRPRGDDWTVSPSGRYRYVVMEDEKQGGMAVLPCD